MDLRKRRKLETTRLIHEAAVLLAREQGADGVTIEAICERAGISQRTFFNYFPYKEAALVFPTPPPSPEASARFLAATGDMMSDLIDLMVEQATELSKGPVGTGLMRDIALANPRVMPLQMVEFLKFETELEALIVKRLGASKGDINCAALAGALIGAARTAGNRLDHEDRAIVPQRMREALEGVVAIIRTNKLR
jgi:AcrR family transcriptional regulator